MREGWVKGTLAVGVFVWGALVASCSSSSESKANAGGGGNGDATPGGGSAPEAGRGAQEGGAQAQSGSGGSTGGGSTGGGGTGGGGTTATAMTPYDACVAYVNAQCNRRDRECGGREALAHPCPFAEELCPDFLFADGSGFDVASALACAETFKTFSCDQLNRGFYPDCVMTPGKRALGEPCTSSHQCASSACGNFDDATHPRCGKCVPIGKQGDPCDDGSFGCGNGFECTGDGCQPQVTFNLPDGALCERYAQCAGDDYCFLAPDGMMRCQPPRKLNEDCSGNALCEAGTNCLDNHCSAMSVASASVGESCIGKPCAQEAWCNYVSSTDAQCIARVGAGEVCELAAGIYDPRGNCQDPALSCYCDGASCIHHCLKQLTEGEACGDPASYCVRGTSCEDGHCVGVSSQGTFEDACLK